MFNKYSSFIKKDQEKEDQQQKPKYEDSNNLKGQLIIKCRESVQNLQQILTKMDSNLENEQIINENYISKEQHEQTLTQMMKDFQATEARHILIIDDLNSQIQNFIRRDEEKTTQILRLQEEISKIKEKSEIKSTQRNDQDEDNQEDEEEESSIPNQICCPNREAIEQQCLEHFQQLVLLLPQIQNVQMLLGAYSREVNDLTWKRMSKNDKTQLKESKRCPECNWIVWSDYFRHRRRCRGVQHRKQPNRRINGNGDSARKIVKK